MLQLLFSNEFNNIPHLSMNLSILIKPTHIWFLSHPHKKYTGHSLWRPFSPKLDLVLLHYAGLCTGKLVVFRFEKLPYWQLKYQVCGDENEHGWKSTQAVYFGISESSCAVHALVKDVWWFELLTCSCWEGGHRCRHNIKHSLSP